MVIGGRYSRIIDNHLLIRLPIIMKIQLIEDDSLSGNGQIRGRHQISEIKQIIKNHDTSSYLSRLLLSYEALIMPECSTREFFKMTEYEVNCSTLNIILRSKHVFAGPRSHRVSSAHHS